MQRVSDRASYTVFLAIGALLILTFLLVRLPRAQSNCVLTTDGKAYFSYLRSFVFDRDLDFHNEYTHLYDDQERAYLPQGTTSTGLEPNLWSVGPALLWAPFYLLGHVFSLMARSVGMQVDTNGYGLIYQSAICMATIAYVTAGCFLTYRVCRRYFSSFACLIGVAGLWLASSLFHYTLGACDMSHGVSFFSVSLFLFVWHPPRSRTYKEWALLGGSVGLMALVRWQDLLFLSMLVVEGIQAVTAGGGGRRSAILREYGKGGLVAGLVAAMVLVPQTLAWNALYGSPITVPQGSGFFDWVHPNLMEYLFSTNHGLYTWTPIMLLGTLGLVALWRRDRKVTLALLIPLLLQWYFNSATTDWWAHSSFGARRFVCATSLLALGMAALTESTAKRFRHGPLVALLAVISLVGWNFLFDLQYSWGFIPRDQAISLQQLTVGKFEMVLELIRRSIKPT